MQPARERLGLGLAKDAEEQRSEWEAPGFRGILRAEGV